MRLIEQRGAELSELPEDEDFIVCSVCREAHRIDWGAEWGGRMDEFVFEHCDHGHLDFKIVVGQSAGRRNG